MVQATTSITTTTTTTTTTTDGDGIGTEKRNVVTSPEASAKTRLLPLSSLLLTEDSDSPNQRRTVQQQQQQRQHEQVAFDNGITISVAWTTPERGPAGATEGNATTATTVNTFFPSASPTAVTGSAIGTTQFQPTSTTTTTPTTTTPPRSGAIVMDKDMHTIVVGVLIALIVILCIVLGLLVLPWIRIYLRRRASNDKRRMQRRYKTVDWWLITKKVAHSPDEPVCSCPSSTESTPSRPTPKLLATMETESTVLDSVIDDDDDDEEEATQQHPECSICMEGFPLNSHVSWSPMPQGCLHVYHRDCIREWLLRHSECPYCRQIMLPIDKCCGERKKTRRPYLHALAAERTRRFEETHFCQVHGLVEVVRKCSDGDNGDGEKVTEDGVVESNCATGSVEPEVASIASQGNNSANVPLGCILVDEDDESEEVPTESPLPEVDGSTTATPPLPFEPPLATGIDHGTDIDVESQEIP